MSWILFALFPPFIYGINGFINKFVVERVKNPLIVTVCMGILLALAGAIIFIVTGIRVLPLPELFIMLFSGLLLNFYLIPYFRALLLDDASWVVPFFQLITVFTILLSFIFLGEHLTNNQLLGVIIIILGAFLLSMKKLEIGILTPRRSLWLMALSSLMYAGTNVTFKLALSTANNNYWTLFAYQCFGVGLGAILMLFSKPVSTTIRKSLTHFNVTTWVLLVTITVIALSAQLSLSHALTLAPVSMVAIIGASQPFFVLFFGIMLSVFASNLFREDMERSTILLKLVSIAIMFVGVIIIYR